MSFITTWTQAAVRLSWGESMKTATFILLVSVLFFFALGFKCGGGKVNFRNLREVQTEALNRQLAALSVVTTTPKGARVQSAQALPAEQLRGVEAAFDLGEAQTIVHNLQNQIGRGGYTVFVVKSERDFNAEGNYAPAFAVPILCSKLYNGAYNDPYCGSIYDKGAFSVNGQLIEHINYVLAAERVVTEDGQFNKWLVADYRGQMIDFMFAVNFGFEHCALRRHDIGQYLQTADHSSGGGHPLLGVSGDIIEQITTANHLTNERVSMQPASNNRGLSPRYTFRPKCAPTPEGDARLMCVVE